MYYVHKYEASNEYGGPEEGGWTYERGIPAEDSIVFMNDDRDVAMKHCRDFNLKELERRAVEEPYEWSSVLSYRSQFYTYKVSEKLIEDPYPAVRPHYE